jgi:DNA-directed RNA polymerase subunit L
MSNRSIKVSKITVSEHSFEEQFKNPDSTTKQCLELMSSKELLSLLPKKTKKTIRFHLENANSQLTNAIRRCLEDEMPTLSLTFNLMHDKDGNPADSIVDLRTNDKNIFGKCDELKKRIEAIPIRQNINPEEWKLSLDIHNKTTDLLNITSSDFKILHKGKNVSVDTLMYPNYILTRLYPNCYFQLSNIYIKKGIGMMNANSFKLLSNIYYEIEDIPLNKVGNNIIGKSSLESDYSKFTLGYSTYRNDLDIYEPIKSACNILIERLNIILEEWEKVKNNSSDTIQIKIVSGAYVITIENEYYTIANVLHYYIYKELPSIEFVSGGIKHLDKMGAVIIIKNKNYQSLFENATKKIIKDLQDILNAFDTKK